MFLKKTVVGLVTAASIAGSLVAGAPAAQAALPRAWFPRADMYRDPNTSHLQATVYSSWIEVQCYIDGTERFYRVNYYGNGWYVPVREASPQIAVGHC